MTVTDPLPNDSLPKDPLSKLLSMPDGPCAELPPGAFPFQQTAPTGRYTGATAEGESEDDDKEDKDEEEEEKDDDDLDDDDAIIEEVPLIEEDEEWDEDDFDDDFDDDFEEDADEDLSFGDEPESAEDDDEKEFEGDDFK
jgi:hypothetical protein